jgi:hypothetical protein
VRAGRTRYAFDAERVLEVADAHIAQQRGHLTPVDLTSFLCRTPQEKATHCIVLDVNPSLAVRADEVYGVESEIGAERIALSGILAERLHPLVSEALLSKGTLSFVLNIDAMRPLRAVECTFAVRAESVSEQVFAIERNGVKLAVDLMHVVQVISAQAINELRLGKSFFGALFFRGLIVPALDVASADVFLMPAFVVLVEVQGQLIALGADRVLGVKKPNQTTDAKILDLTQSISFS